MSHNKELKVNSDNITVLIDIISTTIEFIDLLVESSSRNYKLVEQPHYPVFNDFLIRWKYNLVGIKSIIPQFENETLVKIPIFLMLRTGITDFITVWHLMSFMDKEKLNFESFNNEVKIMNTAFIGLQDRMLEELIQNSKSDVELNKNQEKLDTFRNSYSEYYQEKDGKKSLVHHQKIAGIFRLSSDQGYFLSPEEKDKLTSETQKFNRMKQFPVYNFDADPYYLWRYFSQYEHYSPICSKFYSDDFPKDFDFFQMMISISFIIIGVDSVAQSFDISVDKLTEFREVNSKFSKF